jgi:hypothetical protein
VSFVAAVPISQGWTAVAPALAQLLIVDKSEIVSCLPLNPSSTYFFVAGLPLYSGVYGVA